MPTDMKDVGLGSVVMALTVGLVVRSFVTLPLPYTVVILIVACIIGTVLVYSSTAFGNDLDGSLDKMMFMDPEILFYTLLPILIYQAAFFTDVHIFSREAPQALFLAGPGVLICTVLVAVFVRYAFPYKWGWDTALYFGSMMSATDPVTIVALLKDLGVSERLSVLIEGESLLNDGTAIVIFTIFFNSATGEDNSSPATVISQFLRLTLGGPVVGLMVGACGAFFVGYLLEDPLSEITATVVICFCAFLISEATPLKVSGILAIVFCGLYMSFYGRPRVSATVQEPLRAFWSMASYISNTIIFFMAGLVMADSSWGRHSYIEGRDVGYLIALYIVMHLVRAVMILVAYPALKGGYGTDWRQMLVLVYSGLRGAVGLTLALIVQDAGSIDVKTRERVLFHMVGITLMTLCINGPTMASLLHALNLDTTNKAQTEIFIRACSAIEAKLEHVVEGLKKDRFLGDSDWSIVWRYIPVHTSRIYWHRIRYASINLANGEEKVQRQEQKWWRRITRHAEDIATQNTNYSHLPPRLRSAWQGYHRMYQAARDAGGGVVGVFDDEDMDMDEVDKVIEANTQMEVGNEDYRMLTDQSVHYAKKGTMEGGAFNLGVHGQSYATVGGLVWEARNDVIDDNGLVDELAVPHKHRGTLLKMMLRRSGSNLGTPINTSSYHGASSMIARRSSQPELSMNGIVRPFSSASMSLAAAGGDPTSSFGDIRGGSQDTLSLHTQLSHPALKLSMSMANMRSVCDDNHQREEEARRQIGALQQGILMAKEKIAEVDRELAESERAAEKLAALGRGNAQLQQRRELLLSKLTLDRRTKRVLQGARSGALASVFEVGEEEQLAEARLRFVTAVKANYISNFRKGWLSVSGLRVLRDNANEQLDRPGWPLEEWARLEKSFVIPNWQLTVASTLRNLPFIGGIVGALVFKKLGFIFELASNFIAAHEDIDILELLPEGEAADELAHENVFQLDAASATLGQQLPAFPEVARSLKTQVSARFLLAKHREFIKDLEKVGFLTEKEAEMLFHENTVYRTKLDDHPYADHLPPRQVILRRVPFLRSLGEENVSRLVNDERFVQEEFHGSNVVLMRQGEREIHAGSNKGRAGWYYIVRGSVHMVARSVKRNDRDQTLHAGTVFGMTDQMFGLPFRATYTTSSFVHLFFFDKLALMEECVEDRELNQSIWRTVGVSVLRKFYGFHQMRLQELEKLIFSSEFIDLVDEDNGVETTEAEVLVQHMLARKRSPAGRSPTPDGVEHKASPPDVDDGAIHLKRMKREGKTDSLKKVLSSMGMYSEDQRLTANGLSSLGALEGVGGRDPVVSTNGKGRGRKSSLKIIEVDPGFYLLLVKGQMLARPAMDGYPAVANHHSPALLTDVRGKLVFTALTKMFLVPLSLIERAKTAGDSSRRWIAPQETAERTLKTVQGLNELSVHKARASELLQVDTEPLARSDVTVREQLTKRHNEMARRALERNLEETNDAPAGGGAPPHKSFRGLREKGRMGVQLVSSSSSVSPTKSRLHLDMLQSIEEDERERMSSMLLTPVGMGRSHYAGPSLSPQAEHQ